MNMIERVAQVLTRSLLLAEFGEYPELEQQVSNFWRSNVEHARAAIDAMREPTSNMEEAAYIGSGLQEGSSAYGCWQDMIGAALKESY